MIAISEPFKQDFAFSGYSAFQTRKKINPKNGNKKLKNAMPPLGASGSRYGAGCGMLPFIITVGCDAYNGVLQVGQRVTVSLTVVPQVGQVFIFPFSFDFVFNMISFFKQSVN